MKILDLATVGIVAACISFTASTLYRVSTSPNAVASSQSEVGENTTWNNDNASTNTSDVCRAAIAVLFGREVRTISVIGQRENVLTLRYTRLDDGTVWINRCKLDGDRVLWAADQSGRWRDHNLDEILTFAASGKNINITMTYSDGSSSKQKFDLSQ